MNDKDRLDERTPQELVQIIREGRKMLDNCRKLTKLAAYYSTNAFSVRDRARSYEACQQRLTETRFQLGYLLDKLDAPNPYEKVDNVYQARGEAIDPVEETDQGDIEETDLSVAEMLLEVRSRTEGLIDELEDAHARTRTKKPLFYQHLEQAVMHCREARSHAGMLYSQVSDTQ